MPFCGETATPNGEKGISRYNDESGPVPSSLSHRVSEYCDLRYNLDGFTGRNLSLKRHSRCFWVLGMGLGKFVMVIEADETILLIAPNISTPITRDAHLPQPRTTH